MQQVPSRYQLRLVEAKASDQPCPAVKSGKHSTAGMFPFDGRGLQLFARKELTFSEHM